MNKRQLENLMNTKKTPAYVFDIGILKSRISFLREHLPSGVELCYAVKANTFILREISRWMDWLEICSPGEYQICKSQEISEEKYVISGVYKDAATMNQIMSENSEIGCYTVESKSQFFMLLDLAKQHNKRIRLLLRLTSGNQFGLDKSELMEIIACCRNEPQIELEGIQYFSGTQKASLKRLKRELMMVDEILLEIHRCFGVWLKKLEFGPGFPVSYFEDEKHDEIAYLKTFSDDLSRLQFPGKIVLELGRSIAASCGVYCTKVVDTKMNCNERYAIVDGGMHQFVYFGQILAMRHPLMELVSLKEAAGTEDWNVCGALCTSNDILVKHKQLPSLQIGDMLIFKNAGAYCMTEGIALFLSRNLPDIIIVDENGTDRIVRQSTSVTKLNMPK